MLFSWVTVQYSQVLSRFPIRLVGCPFWGTTFFSPSRDLLVQSALGSFGLDFRGVLQVSSVPNGFQLGSPGLRLKSETVRDSREGRRPDLHRGLGT